MMDQFTVIYLVAVNFMGVIFMGIDKKHARLRGVRFPEKLLLLLAVIGASPGIYAAMWIFTHKTRKKIFLFGIPLIMALQLLLFFIAVNE